MSSSTGLPSNKIKWNKSMTAKLNHEVQTEALKVREAEKAEGPKKKKSKKVLTSATDSVKM